MEQFQREIGHRILSIIYRHNRGLYYWIIRKSLGWK